MQTSATSVPDMVSQRLVICLSELIMQGSASNSTSLPTQKVVQFARPTPAHLILCKLL